MSAQWKRQLVNEMMIQFAKNDALVMEINQFKTVRPPAIVVASQLTVSISIEKGVNLPLN